MLITNVLQLKNPEYHEFAIDIKLRTSELKMLPHENIISSWGH